MRELKFAVRQLLKAPGFTATAVLMLALGIGATTAIFSIVEGVLVRPLPFHDSERLVSLSDILKGADLSGNGEAGVTAPDIRNYTRDTHSFASLGGYGQTQYELSGAGEPAQVNGARMSPGVFSALKVQPLMGRFCCLALKRIVETTEADHFTRYVEEATGSRPRSRMLAYSPCRMAWRRRDPPRSWKQKTA
jgi:hypothetical protein